MVEPCSLFEKAVLTLCVYACFCVCVLCCVCVVCVWRGGVGGGGEEGTLGSLFTASAEELLHQAM